MWILLVYSHLIIIKTFLQTGEINEIHRVECTCILRERILENFEKVKRYVGTLRRFHYLKNEEVEHV